MIIESDAKNVADCLHSDVFNILEFGSIIHHCKSLVRQCEDVQVVFSPRTANIAAHILAQNARSFLSNQFW